MFFHKEMGNQEHHDEDDCIKRNTGNVRLAKKVEGIRVTTDRPALIHDINQTAQHDQHPDGDDNCLHPVPGNQITVNGSAGDQPADRR